MKRVALILATIGATLLGSASVWSEERGGAFINVEQRTMAGSSPIFFGGSTERSGGIFFGVTSGREHFDRHPGDRHFHRRDFDHRHFQRGDFDDRHFRHGHFDRRDFHRGRFDRRFFPHDRGHFHGGAIFGEDVRVWRNYDDSATVIIEDYPLVGTGEDSRTTTYRGSEISPDDPGSRTTTYRGGGRTLGNVPGR